MKPTAGIIAGLFLSTLVLPASTEAAVIPISATDMPGTVTGPDLILVGRGGGHGRGHGHGHGHGGHRSVREGHRHASHSRVAHLRMHRHHRLAWQRKAYIVRFWVSRSIALPRGPGTGLISPVQFGPVFPVELAIGAATVRSTPPPVTDIAARPHLFGDNLATSAIGESDDEGPSPGAIDCRQAADIIAGYGFSDVSARHCNGAQYSFDATRDTQLYAVTINARDGELEKVAKYDGPSAPMAN